jgi:hypothetical protein
MRRLVRTFKATSAESSAKPEDNSVITEINAVCKKATNAPVTSLARIFTSQSRRPPGPSRIRTIDFPRPTFPRPGGNDSNGRNNSNNISSSLLQHR